MERGGVGLGRGYLFFSEPMGCLWFLTQRWWKYWRERRRNERTRGLLFAVMRGSAPEGHSGHAESSRSISFQEFYELGCGVFLLLPQYCCCRKTTKMLGKI